MLELCDQLDARPDAWRKDDERLDDVAARVVGRRDDRALRHRGVLERCLLDLEAGDVVAGRDDHVVGADLEPEVAGLVDEVDVASEVPPRS